MGGVSSTDRRTTAVLKARAKLIVRERLLTDGDEEAKTYFDVVLEGEDAGCDLVSRSVAKGKSRQSFISRIVGRPGATGTAPATPSSPMRPWSPRRRIWTPSARRRP